MRALLDTHVLLFWLYEPSRLGTAALRLLSSRDNAVFWSVASSWEIAIKVALGRLRLDGPVAEIIPFELSRNGVSLLSIDHRHVLAVSDLPRLHGDPFDRLLVAQALAEDLVLVSDDSRLHEYGVPTVW